MRKTILPLLMLAALLATESRGQQSNQFEVDLQEAIRKETVEGDLNGAIEQYEEIAEGSDRVIAAKALIRMAACYEKLGVAESRKIYERVIRDYADQQEAAAVARAKLATGDPTTSVKGDRVVWAGKKVVDSFGTVSRDGRFISYVDWWEEMGTLMLHDLSTGTHRPLTRKGSCCTSTSTFSWDGKRIAYGWMSLEPKRGEIWIVNLEHPGNPKKARVYLNEDLGSISPTDWSSDGKWLAVHLRRKDRTGQIALFNVQDRSLRVLKSTDWRGPGKMLFSPDSRFLAYSLPAGDSDPQRDLFFMAIDGSREIRVTENPANDLLMGWSPDGRLLLFSSDRTGPMGLWSVSVDEGEERATPTLLKPDIGLINGDEASFGLTGSGVLYIAKNVSTAGLQVAPIDLETGKLTGAPVFQSVRSQRPDWSSEGKYLAFRATGSSREAILTIRSTETGEVSELRPKLNYFNEPRWMPDGRSLMTFGADFNGRRGIYRIDIQNGETSFVVASQLCRVQISPDGKKVYYASPDEPRRKMELDLLSGEARTLFEYPEDSIFDASLTLSPDGRYLGGTRRDKDSSHSAVVAIPVTGGEPRELLRVSWPETFWGTGSVAWTPDSRAMVLFKTRRGPGGTWSKELWHVAVSGGEARKLDVDVDSWLLSMGGIRLSPSGTQIAFFTGKISGEVWALEGLLPSQSAGN